MPCRWRTASHASFETLTGALSTASAPNHPARRQRRREVPHDLVFLGDQVSGRLVLPIVFLLAAPALAAAHHAAVRAGRTPCAGRGAAHAATLLARAHAGRRPGARLRPGTRRGPRTHRALGAAVASSAAASAIAATATAAATEAAGHGEAAAHTAATTAVAAGTAAGVGPGTAARRVAGAIADALEVGARRAGGRHVVAVSVRADAGRGVLPAAGVAARLVGAATTAAGATDVVGGVAAATAAVETTPAATAGADRAHGVAGQADVVGVHRVFVGERRERLHVRGGLAAIRLVGRGVGVVDAVVLVDRVIVVGVPGHPVPVPGLIRHRHSVVDLALRRGELAGLVGQRRGRLLRHRLAVTHPLDQRLERALHAVRGGPGVGRLDLAQRILEGRLH